jgi:hypothetical protein
VSPEVLWGLPRCMSPSLALFDRSLRRTKTSVPRG